MSSMYCGGLARAMPLSWVASARGNQSGDAEYSTRVLACARPGDGFNHASLKVSTARARAPQLAATHQQLRCVEARVYDADHISRLEEAAGGPRKERLQLVGVLAHANKHLPLLASLARARLHRLLAMQRLGWVELACAARSKGRYRLCATRKRHGTQLTASNMDQAACRIDANGKVVPHGATDPAHAARVLHPPWARSQLAARRHHRTFVLVFLEVLVQHVGICARASLSHGCAEAQVLVLTHCAAR